MNGDGTIDKNEFRDYYEQTAAKMSKFHKANAAKKAESKTVHFDDAYDGPDHEQHG